MTTADAGLVAGGAGQQPREVAILRAPRATWLPDASAMRDNPSSSAASPRCGCARSRSNAKVTSDADAVDRGRDHHRHRHELRRRSAPRDLRRQHVGQAEPERQACRRSSRSSNPSRTRARVRHDAPTRAGTPRSATRRYAKQVFDSTTAAPRERHVAAARRHASAAVAATQARRREHQQALLRGTQIGIGAERGHRQHHERAATRAITTVHASVAQAAPRRPRRRSRR